MKSIAAALDAILALHPGPIGAERVTLEGALGRVLAEAVTSPRALPPFDNSAMDGYALRLADARPGAVLPIVDESAAGRPAARPLGPGEAMRIFTGAPTPEGAELVVMQELTERDGDRVTLSAELPPAEARANIRPRAGDVTAGAELLPAGALIGPGEIGLLAACGRGRLSVRRRPRVAVISTGDELREIEDPLGPGQIVNSNAPTLAALVREAGGEPVVLPIVRDRSEDHARAFAEGARCDLILTTGGVSVGDHDLVQPTLDRLGWRRAFWKVALKPGKPVLAGTLGAGGAVVLGLPGNPASAMVTFELFARPLIRRMQDHPRPFRRVIRRPLAGAMTKKPGRTHVLRGRLTAAGFSAPAPQGSGLLRSMVEVEALAFLAAERERFAAGDEVPVVELRHDGVAEPQPGLFTEVR